MQCRVKRIIVAEFSDAKGLVRALIKLGLSSTKIAAQIYEYSGMFRLVIHATTAHKPNIPTLRNSYIEYFKTLEYGRLIFKSIKIAG